MQMHPITSKISLNNYQAPWKENKFFLIKNQAQIEITQIMLILPYAEKILFVSKHNHQRLFQITSIEQM